MVNEVFGENLTYFLIPPQLRKHEEWNKPQARPALIIQMEAPYGLLLEYERREHGVHVYPPT